MPICYTGKLASITTRVFFGPYLTAPLSTTGPNWAILSSLCADFPWFSKTCTPISLHFTSLITPFYQLQPPLSLWSLHSVLDSVLPSVNILCSVTSAGVTFSHSLSSQDLSFLGASEPDMDLSWHVQTWTHHPLTRHHLLSPADFLPMKHTNYFPWPMLYLSSVLG